jgi:hypothetical protein
MANITIQDFPTGFGSYLDGILPPDIATAAGAFGVSVSQVKNITNVPVEKFAQVCMNLETIAGLPVNGTTVPTNLDLRTAARPLIALGSGPQQSYTMSDFFGCMSGLPYNGPLINIYNQLNAVATRKLFNIYHELYLAVTYARARMVVTQTVTSQNIQSYIAPDPSAIPPVAGQPRIDDWYYTISFNINSSYRGGGYGRGTAPPPIITIQPNNVGASATSTIGTNDTEIPGLFGRVKTISANFGSPYKYATTTVMSPSLPAQPTPPEEIVYIELPPPDNLPVQANGNFSTAGTNVSLGYGVGTAGTIVPGAAQWPGMNTPIQLYIDQANEEINVILAAKPAQCKSLNDSWNETGYQLTIEQRARVSALRPPLDDVTREDFLSLFPTSQYTFVDSIPQYAKNIMPHMYAQTLEAICNLNTPGGQSIVAMMRESRNQNRLVEMGVTLDNNIRDTLTTLQQSILAGTPVAVGSQVVPVGVIPIASYDIATSDIIITNPDYSTDNPGGDGTSGGGTATGSTTSSPSNVPSNTTNVFAGQSGNGGGSLSGSVVDFGNSNVIGSFGGSPYSNITPPNLNIYYISNTLLPSTYTIAESIDEVIRCNCDCWDLT